MPPLRRVPAGCPQVGGQQIVFRTGPQRESRPGVERLLQDFERNFLRSDFFRGDFLAQASGIVPEVLDFNQHEAVVRVGAG